MLTYSNSILEPLKAFASRMLVVEGLATTPALLPNNPNDPIGSRTLYVGHEHITLNRFTGSAANDANNDHMPYGPSLEYVLGQKFGGTTAVRSLQMGIGVSSGNSYSDTLSFNNNAQRLPGIASPSDAFTALFGAAGPTPPADTEGAKRAAARRLSVVGALKSSAKRMQSRLGGVERTKLDEHMAALADIESRLSSPQYVPISCGTPTPPGPAPTVSVFGGAEAVPASTDLQFDILTQAFACDRTRFVSARWGDTLGGTIPWLFGSDVKDMHGDVAHLVDDEGAAGQTARLRLAKLNNWYAQRLAGFMSRLESIPEGNGTLLDNTLIVWTTDFGEHTHSGLNVPFILLGGAQKKFRMGRYMNVSKPNPSDPQWVGDPKRFTATNHLLVSILNAFGDPSKTFGTTEFSGPLAGLV
jgi:hypothetical protein